MRIIAEKDSALIYRMAQKVSQYQMIKIVLNRNEISD